MQNSARTLIVTRSVLAVTAALAAVVLVAAVLARNTPDSIAQTGVIRSDRTLDSADLPGYPPDHTIFRIELYWLQKDGTGVSSSYVITNQGSDLATCVHAYYNLHGSVVGSLSDTIPGSESRKYDLGPNPVIPDHFTGYVIVSSNQPITGVGPPPPFSVHLPLIVKEPPQAPGNVVISHVFYGAVKVQDRTSTPRSPMAVVLP
jgi:hypothetical protein